jgi:hypothetical protein
MNDVNLENLCEPFRAVLILKDTQSHFIRDTTKKVHLGSQGSHSHGGKCVCVHSTRGSFRLDSDWQKRCNDMLLVRRPLQVAETVRISRCLRSCVINVI